jgi:hypothetical protein
MPLVLSIRIDGGRPPPSRGAILEAFEVNTERDDGADAFEIGRPATGSTCLVTFGAGDAVPSSGLSSTSSDDAADTRVFADVRVIVPLARAPFLADDLLPALVASAQALGGVLVDVEHGSPLPTFERARAQWLDVRRRELHALYGVCVESGAPLPAMLPASDLVAMHAWLVRVADLDDGAIPIARLVLGFDARDGEDVSIAVRAPRAARVRIPPWPYVLIDPQALGPRSVDEEDSEAPRLVARTRLVEGLAPDDDGLYTVDLDARVRELAETSPDLSPFRIVAPCEILDRESLVGS